MKKYKFINRMLSAGLASVMLVGAFAACGKKESTGTFPSNIITASSDADQYAVWLNDRLDGYVPEDVVLGVGSNGEYAVDMSAFEDDGYIIRKQNGAVVIFGKSADGLDRGVRKYANAVDMGEDVADVTYHEGERIEELRLFGTDISEFDIVYADSANDNMIFAAEELQTLLEKATGHSLDVVQGASYSEHKIELRHTEDPVLEDDGYRYFEEMGNLIIEGAVARGCSNGVYRFLQNECGWEGLIYGDSYLEEADLIEIPVGLSETETPIMGYLYVHTNAWNQYKSDRRAVAWNARELSYGSHDHAHHGMEAHRWTDDIVNVDTSQICYSNEGKVDHAYENIVAYIEARKAAGAVVGVSLKDIDVSQGDNGRYCHCSSCSEMIYYDKSDAGPVVWFANQIAERLEADGYENMNVHIFAYFASKKPPEVTVPRDDVCITFAQNGNCSNHSMYGTDCEYVEAWDEYMVTDSNANNHEWLSEWCEISDNIVVWYYALDTGYQQYTILDFMLDDFRYMDEYGIRGMFWQNTYHGFGVKRVEQQLGVEINWNRDMTDEEYEAELCRLLKREYGPGWRYIREYIEYMNKATDLLGCFSCWGYATNKYNYYDEAFIRQYYKDMMDLVEKAVSMAGSADEEYRCKLLSCSIYYNIAYSSYFIAYENEDTEMLAELEGYYNTVYNRTVELGFDPEAINSVDNNKITVYPTLEEEAWNVWIDSRERHTGKSASELRPAPDWVTTE